MHHIKRKTVSHVKTSAMSVYSSTPNQNYALNLESRKHEICINVFIYVNI